MRTILIAASFAAAGLISLAGISQAMPVIPLADAAAGAGLVTATSGGCAWFDHRGPFGHCRPLYNCPRGFKTGRFGQVCHRD